MSLNRWVGGLIATAAFLSAAPSPAEPVTVRYTEGVVHGFLVLRTLDGTTLAEGELIQTARGNQVKSRLVFHFRDGSIHDEAVVFSQRGRFRLLSDRVIQQGPTFPHPLDMSIEAATGHVVVRYASDDGQPKSAENTLELPLDIANGLIPILLKNVRAGADLGALSMVAATPKPRLVKLSLVNSGEERFTLAGAPHRVTHYVLKVHLGGVAGVVAPVLGKQPPDTHVWILGGEAPAFLSSEGPLYAGGPVWRIELAGPDYRHARATTQLDSSNSGSTRQPTRADSPAASPSP